MGSVVYHYSDAQAFASMVEKATVRATDFRYLNDSRELTYVWDAFIAKLRQLAEGPDDGFSEAYAAQLEALRLMDATDLMGFDDTMFVVCFTELDDAVSQWSRYGANGHGIALGFDAEAIRALHAPMFRHLNRGQLEPLTDQNEKHLTWPGYLQKVGYGEDRRDAVVDGLIANVQDLGGKDHGGDFKTIVANSICQTHAWIHRLPLVKHDAFEDEREHRITIAEHLGGRSAMQRRALSALGRPFSELTGGTLDTLDVKFRPGGATVFKPYVELPFPHEALVNVVIGPAIKHRLAESTVRRLLDRNGFRHTVVEQSQLPYQT